MITLEVLGLDREVGRLSAIVSELPVGVSSADLLLDMLIRLDHKLMNTGIDDSNGTVGNFIFETVGVLKEYAKSHSEIKSTFKRIENRESNFGWEEELLKD